MKDNIIALHQKNIAEGAEKLFRKNGFHATSISDISEISGYSRRTMYRYFESKEEILYFLILQGLEFLTESLQKTIDSKGTFIQKYNDICESLLYYYENFTLSARSVNQFQSNANLQITPRVELIFTLGVKINELLASWIKQGIEEKILDESIEVMPTVYVLSTNLHALFEQVSSKEPILLKSLNKTKEEFLTIGYKMNLKSIVKVDNI